MNRLLLFLFIPFFLTSCLSDEIDETNSNLDLNHIVHYTFTGNANDQSGYSNHGIVENANLTLDSFSTPNSAYNFTGSSYIEIPDNDILDFKENKLTISAWIKPAYGSGSYIVQKANQVNSQGQLAQGGGPFSLDIFPGKPRALIYGSNNSPIILTGTSRVKLNVWQHLAVTWDGNMAYLYYNGQLEASGEFSNILMVTNGNIYIGAYKWTFPSATFKGSIDNVRMYNRYLTSSEIQELYYNYEY